MKFKFFLACACSLVFASALNAHFQMVLPSSSSVSDEANANLKITYKFNHPFEQNLMSMSDGAKFGVFFDGKKSDIKADKKSENNFTFYEANYAINEPGAYQFFVEPAPYFEPAENTFIKHITKTVVNAFGGGEGWNKPIGLKAEIVPLTRPYGLYKGNNFSAKVLYKGKPAKNIPVEVEYYNKNGLKAPTDDHVTQEVMTNENGEFSFTMPLTGWWGFAALIEDDETIKKDGKDYPIELGGVIWVETKDYIK